MKEEDIRPDTIFNDYLLLAEKDFETYFRDVPYYFGSCPACGNKNGELAFRKMGFDYEECPECGTLFVNPRPYEEAFCRYYEDSPSVRYWATHFYKQTETSRRERLIKPKARMVKDSIDKYSKTPSEESCIIDIGAGYGVFCEEIQQLLPDNVLVIGIEPAKALQEVCQNKEICIIPKFFEDVATEDLKGKRIKIATSFELLEHLHNPGEFIKKCSELLNKDALLFLTTLTWDGFDLQILREKSRSIYPPFHINFFTKKGITILLEKWSFEICNLETPGKLDVDIVSKMKHEIKDPFIQLLLSQNDDVTMKFQTFLQEAKLSSHMMIVAKRK